MKFVKKLTALFLAIVMTMAMGVTAFAADPVSTDTYSITIKGENVTTGHTYTAYQVFTGTLLAKGEDVLGDIEWGKDVDGAAIIADLKASTVIGSKFDQNRNDYTAADIAKILETFKDKSDEIKEFARIAAAHATGGTSTSKFVAAANGKGGSYTIDQLRAGYYVVADTTEDLPAGEERTNYILEVVDNVEIAAKIPTIIIDKNIIDTDANAPIEETDGKVDTAAIGDVLNYEITGTVPEHQSYTYYYYVVSDTLSKGLDLLDGSEAKGGKIGDGFTVTIKDPDTVDEQGNVTETGKTHTLTYLGDGSAQVQATDDGYYLKITPVTKDGVATGETKFELSIANIKNYTPGGAISIKYNAKINADAEIGLDPNTNSAVLDYSNNPKQSNGGTGIPDEETKKKNPTGTTVDVETRTYVTKLNLLKVDAKDQTKTLEGAIFQLTGENLNTIKFTFGKKFVEDATGTYYLLKDGTYTTEKPNAEWTDTSVTPNVKHEANWDLYENIPEDKTGDENHLITPTKAYKVTEVAESTVIEPETGKTRTITAEVDEDGKLTFTGLNVGDYTLKEIKAPAGYNKLTEEIKFTIGVETGKDATTGKLVVTKWTVEDQDPKKTTDIKYVETTDTKTGKTAGTFQITVGNNKGAELPSTGGMGTTVIYIAGIAMIIAAGVVIIARKRMA